MDRSRSATWNSRLSIRGCETVPLIGTTILRLPLVVRHAGNAPSKVRVTGTEAFRSSVWSNPTQPSSAEGRPLVQREFETLLDQTWPLATSNASGWCNDRPGGAAWPVIFSNCDANGPGANMTSSATS